MLRGVLLGFAILLMALAIAGLLADPGTWPFLLMAIVVLVGVVFERRRYGAAQAAAPAGGDWRATAERFVDETGEPVRVWFNTATGERRYVKDDSAPA